MLKEDKLPFQHDDFFDQAVPGIARQGTMKRETSQLQKQTDKFLSTLGQGFGAAASAANNSMVDQSMEKVISPRDSRINKSQVSMKEQVPNYYEFRVKELQEELDQMHALINEEHGHDSVLANYVD